VTSDQIRQRRSLSFGLEAAAYERGRPSYPPEAIDWLLSCGARDVLDLGDIAYANPACAEMLGYVDGKTVTRLHLPELLSGHSALTPSDCVNTLRTAEGIVGWNHAQDYVIRTMVSPPLLLRDSDQLLLISITDVTDSLWESKPASGVHETIGHSP